MYMPMYKYIRHSIYNHTPRTYVDTFFCFFSMCARRTDCNLRNTISTRRRAYIRGSTAASRMRDAAVALWSRLCKLTRVYTNMADTSSQRGFRRENATGSSFSWGHGTTWGKEKYKHASHNRGG
uniref:Uncharacterized protein n=1 Tax=Rhipicephalus zambeziensis TaxID=60191 RepID=A0A224Y8Y1_9ACAR